MSYYKTIDGKKYDGQLLELADKLVQGDGVPGAMVSVVCTNALYRSVNGFKLESPAAILYKTAELVIEAFKTKNEEVKDGNSYTDIEKDTMAYIRDNYKWTDAADEWFRTEIRKWAATK